MVKREFFKTRTDGVNLYRTYSDIGMQLIRNDGVVYDDAIDVEDAEYTYVETDEPIETVEEVIE